MNVLNTKAKDEQEPDDDNWWLSATERNFVKPVPNVPPMIIPAKRPWREATTVKWAVTCDLTGNDTKGDQEPRVVPPRKVPRIVPAIRSVEDMSQDPKIIVPLQRYSRYWQAHGGSRTCWTCEDLYKNKNHNFGLDCRL